MVERHSGFVQQVAGVGKVTVEDHRYAQSALWTPTGAITSQSGMVPVTVNAADPGAVTATSPTPNGLVHVGAFRYVMQSGRGGGVYTLTLDAIKDVNVLGDQAADPSNNRNDLIVAQQSDAFFGDANSDMLVRHVIGTPSGAPVDPTVTGSSDYITLARVVVRANTTSILGSDITNFTQLFTVATGGVVPVRTQAERDAMTQATNGQLVWRRDVSRLEAQTSSGWRAMDFTKTSSLANITSPLTGQVAYLTSDNRAYVWDGSAWAVLNVSKAASCRVRFSGTFSQPASDLMGQGGWAAVAGEDPLGMFSIVGTPTAFAQIKIPVGLGGKWRVQIRGRFDGATGARMMGVNKNSTATSAGFILRDPRNATSTGGDGTMCRASEEITLADNDVLRFVTWSSVVCTFGAAFLDDLGAEIYVSRVGN